MTKIGILISVSFRLMLRGAVMGSNSVVPENPTVFIYFPDMGRCKAYLGFEHEKLAPCFQHQSDGFSFNVDLQHWFLISII